MPSDLLVEFLAVIFIITFFPQLLRRLGIPKPLSEIGMGMLFGGMALDVFATSEIITLFSGIGIILLFLHAGLDVELEFLRQERKIFFEHLLVQFFTLVLSAAAVHFTFRLNLAVSILVGLAIATPSAGFIISFLKQEKLGDYETTWVRNKAIAAEILGILLLMVVDRLDEMKAALMTLAAVVAILLILPKILSILYHLVIKHVLDSHFPFVLLIALSSAVATEHLGMHFLVGAFIAGIVVKIFTITTHEDRENEVEHLSKGLVFLTPFFLPFYFFSVGLHMRRDMVTPESFLVAVTLLLIVMVVRLAAMLAYRTLRLKEKFRKALRISSLLMPTLIFTLVIVDILTQKNLVSPVLAGGLVLYALSTTILPKLVTNAVVPEDSLP